MLNFVKQELQNRLKEQEDTRKAFDNSIDDTDIMLEFTSVFSELSDLSAEGKLNEKEDSDRKISDALDYSEEDDVDLYDDDTEIETLEMNATDGRLTNVPGDASVMESANYIGMKSYKSFFTEAVNSFSRFPRETYEDYKERCAEYAKEKYNAYMNDFYQESNLNIGDLSVPYEVTINFGKSKASNGENYYQTLPIYWELGKKNTVKKKQVESLQAFIKLNTFENFQKLGKDVLKDTIEFGEKDFFEVLKPVGVYIPIEPLDQYKVYVDFKLLTGSKTVSLGIGYDIKEVVKMLKGVKKEYNKTHKESTTDRLKDTSASKPLELTSMKGAPGFVTKAGYEIKVEQEAYMEEYKKKKRASLNRFYQEEDDPNAAGTATPAPSVSAGGSSDPAPSVDANAGGTDPNAANAGGTDANANGGTDQNAGGEDTTQVDTNDVSDRILDKVNDATQNTNDVSDVPDGSTEDDLDVDSAIDSLDDIGSDDGGSDLGEDNNAGDNGSADNQELPTEATEGDFDQMTIDQLLEQGKEKLKSMKIDQIKNFISNGAAGDGGALGESYSINKDLEDIGLMIQEAVHDNTDYLKTCNDLEELIAIQEFAKFEEKLENIINTIISGLNKIITCIDNKTMAVSDFKKFWGRTPRLSMGITGEAGFGLNFSGDKFRVAMKKLLKYMKKGNRRNKFGADSGTATNVTNSLKVFLKNAKLASKGKYPLDKISAEAKPIVSDLQTLSKTAAASDVVKESYHDFLIEEDIFCESDRENAEREMFQESVLLTAKNAKSEIHSWIKKCLGILNDDEMEYKKLAVKLHTACFVLANKLSAGRVIAGGVFSQEERRKMGLLQDQIKILTGAIVKSKSADGLREALTRFVDLCVEVDKFCDTEDKNDKKDK